MLMLLIASTLFLATGCDKKECSGPTISVDNASTANNSTVKPGDKIAIKIVASKGTDCENLKYLTLSYSNNLGVSGVKWKKALSSESVNWDTTFNALAIATESMDETWTITVEDKDAKTATRTIKYTIKKEGTVEPTAAIFKSFELDNDNGFAALAKGTTYTGTSAAAAAASIDLTYFYSTTSKNNLTSPAARNNATIYGDTYKITWGAVETELRKADVTTAQWNEAKADQSKIKALFDGGTKVTAVGGAPDGTRYNDAGGLAAGKYVAFKGAGNKYGVLYITTVASDENGSLKFDVIIEN